MNPLHLLWIAPLSAILGFAACAVSFASKEGVDNQKHGHWVMVNHSEVEPVADYACSVCSGLLIDVIDDFKHELNPYCPMCGAKMDGDKYG